MSTEPEGWSSPKTNWTPNDNIGASDLNRWEGNPLAIETGDRTLDQSQTPASHVGGLRQILDWFANRIKAITGATNWYDAPATTLAAAKSHVDASITSSTVHGIQITKISGTHTVAVGSSMGGTYIRGSGHHYLVGSVLSDDGKFVCANTTTPPAGEAGWFFEAQPDGWWLMIVPYTTNKATSYTYTVLEIGVS